MKEFFTQAGIFTLCWLVGVPIAFGLSWWWEFNPTVLAIVLISFVVGLIIRFLPHALEDLV